MKYNTGIMMIGLSKEVEEKLQALIYKYQKAFEASFIDLCVKHDVGENELDIDEYHKGRGHIGVYLATSTYEESDKKTIAKMFLNTFRDTIRKAAKNKKKAKRLMRNSKNYELLQKWSHSNT
mgnify:FL=1